MLITENECVRVVISGFYLYSHIPSILRGHKGTVLVLIIKETKNKSCNFFFVIA
jgi:hypothetical protein